tara:strand:+ start:40 stop:717 length:678 start_codon:yes stop_codon:yes gene_type:complete
MSKRTCVLLSGQLREATNYYKNIKKNLIDVYKADVFISTWEDSGVDCSIGDVVDLYKPIAYEVEKENLQFLKDITSPFEWRTPNQATDSLSTFAMFYKILRVHRLKTFHNSMRLDKYDTVIRCRFDLEINSPIGLIEPKEDTLYIPKGWDWEGGYNDLFAIGDSKTMNYYSNAFYHLSGLLDEGYMLHPEFLLKQYLDKASFNIERPLMDMSLKGVKIFEKANYE